MADDKKNNTPIDFKTPEEAFAFLRTLPSKKDKDINIAEAALALSLIFMPTTSIDRYRYYVKALEEETAIIHKKKRGDDNLYKRVETLREVIYYNGGFGGERIYFDYMENINFIKMLETRKGIPVTIGILLMHLSDYMGWDCTGVNFPGHFLLKMDGEGERAILDPLDNGRFMEAHDLRDLIKSILGHRVELSYSFYNSVKKRDVLLRLQNNLKARFIDTANYTGAILAVEGVEAFYPEEYRIYLDKGVLYAKLRDFESSVTAIERYITLTPYAQERQQAQILLDQIKATLL